MDRLFWIDLEMTGLDVDREAIIEVAALVTDMDFHVLDTFETVVKQPQYYLDRMDEWNRTHHGQSGLITKVPFGMEQDKVEAKLCEMIRKNFPMNEGKAVLAGNSIMQDRLFINKYLPQFASLLHYRMLDVTAWKIVFQEKFNLKYKKRGSHRALDDIQDSIEELRFYLSHMHIPENF